MVGSLSATQWVYCQKIAFILQMNAYYKCFNQIGSLKLVRIRLSPCWLCESPFSPKKWLWQHLSYNKSTKKGDSIFFWKTVKSFICYICLNGQGIFGLCSLCGLFKLLCRERFKQLRLYKVFSSPFPSSSSFSSPV